MRLKQKVAIVTGAATGIGQAIATAFAAEGAAVVVDYVGRPELAAETLQKIQTAGVQAIAVAADVSDPGQVQNLVQQAVARFGRLDILVNNAGIEFKRPFLEFPFRPVEQSHRGRSHWTVAVRAGSGAADGEAGRRRTHYQYFFGT